MEPHDNRDVEGGVLGEFLGEFVELVVGEGEAAGDVMDG
jgi:hypothetical protein